MQKLKNLFSNTLVVILIVVLGLASFLFLNNRLQNNEPAAQAPEPQETVEQTPTATTVPTDAVPPADDTPEPTWTPHLIDSDDTLPPQPSPPPTFTPTPVNPRESVLYSFDVPASLGEVSPDGETLAFNRSDVETDKYPINQVWLMDLATGKTSQLIERGRVGNTQVWSPDGTKLAYHQSGTKGLEEVGIAMIDSNVQRSLLRQDDILGHYWIDVDHLGLIRTTSVDKINLAGQVMEKRSVEVRLAPSGIKPEVQGISTDGMVARIENKSLRITLSNGDEYTIQTAERNQIFEFAIAPNGKLVAYITAQGNGTALWISNIDGQQPQKLLERAGDNRGNVSRLSWSADSGLMVGLLSEFGTSPNSQLFLVTIQNNQITPLKVDGLDYAAAIFSPDSQTLYYARTTVPDTSVYGKTTFYQLQVQ